MNFSTVRLLIPRCSIWLATVLFTGFLILYTRNNDFAYYYHPDEYGKVRQVAEGTRNGNHPLLMLTATRAVAALLPGDLPPQKLVVVGRWVVAGFAAGSVVALALLAYALHGQLAAWIAGVTVGLNQLLFQLAHYMKEDAVLLFGFAVTLLALHHFWQQRSVGSIRLLGAAAAIAISGKYVGAAALIVALPAVLLTNTAPGNTSRFSRLAQFSIPFLLVLVVLNYSFLTQPHSLQSGLSRETAGAMAGQGLPRRVPHAFYVQEFMRSTPLAVQLLSGAYLLILLWRWRRARLIEWTLLCFTLGFGVVLSFSPLAGARYGLPVMVLATFLAVLSGWEIGILLFGKWLKRPLLVNSLAGVLVGGLLIWVHVPAIERSFGAYRQDDRKELIHWIRNNLPATASIAQDSRAGLPIPGRWQHPTEAILPQQVISNEFVADLGSLEELRAKGIRYVLICHETYNRFFKRGVRPGGSGAAADPYFRRQAFYSHLLQEHQPIWQSKPGAIHYLQPGLKLFELGSADADNTMG